jgi:hypothetical protein
LAAIVLVLSVVPPVNYFAGRGARDYALWYDTGQLIVHRQEIYPPRHHTFPLIAGEDSKKFRGA